MESKKHLALTLWELFVWVIVEQVSRNLGGAVNLVDTLSISKKMYVQDKAINKVENLKQRKYK